MRKEELHFFLTVCPAMQGILLKDLQETLKALFAVMKVGNRLVQLFCRKMGEKVLKVAESVSTFIEVCGFLDEIVGDGILDEKIDTEEVLLRVFIVVVRFLAADFLNTF